MSANAVWQSAGHELDLFETDNLASRLRETLMSDKGKSTSFKSEDREDGSGKTDHYFNREGDGGNHGHVVTSNDGQETHFARDEDNNTYVDDSK